MYLNKKKILISILIVALIAIIATVVIILLGKSGGKGTEDVASKEINMDEVSNRITENSAFKEMPTIDITMDLVDSYFGINKDNVEAVVGKIPAMNVHASMYVILKAKDQKADEVKTQLESYAKNYEDMWATYLPEQYELVKQRRLGAKGNYVYLIIAENAGELEDLIK